MPGSDRLRLFPLNSVLFPGAALNLHVFEPRYRQMIAECLDTNEAFGVVLIRDGAEAGDPDVAPHDIGTTAEISDVTPLPSGRYYIRTAGRRRFRIRAIVSREPYLLAEVEYLEETAGDPATTDVLMAQLTHEFRAYAKLLGSFSGSETTGELPHDALAASYAIGDVLQIADSLKQQLLEAVGPVERLEAELGFLRRLLPQLRALLDRKREKKKSARETPVSATRSAQEKFFGKHFSNN